MSSDKAVIAVRFDQAMYDDVVSMAKSEGRSLANMTEFLARVGLQQIRKGEEKGKHVVDVLRRHQGAIKHPALRPAQQMDIAEMIARKVRSGPIRRKK